MVEAGLYEDDFLAWTRSQASALRDLAERRWNGPLDLDHLAEEIEDLGSERLFFVLSRLERVIQHLLKLEHSPSAAPRRDWLNTVDTARAEIRRRLTRSMERHLADELPDLHRRARRIVSRQLADFGEAEHAASLPVELPYSEVQLLDENWYPTNRHGLTDEP